MLFDRLTHLISNNNFKNSHLVIVLFGLNVLSLYHFIIHFLCKSAKKSYNLSSTEISEKICFLEFNCESKLLDTISFSPLLTTIGLSSFIISIFSSFFISQRLSLGCFISESLFKIDKSGSFFIIFSSFTKSSFFISISSSLIIFSLGELSIFISVSFVFEIGFISSFLVSFNSSFDELFFKLSISSRYFNGFIQYFLALCIHKP